VKKGWLKIYLVKFNDLPLFDPSLWPRREMLSRLTGSMICMAFIVHRILRFFHYTGDSSPLIRKIPDIAAGKLSLLDLHLDITDFQWIMWFLIWVIETCIFAGYILGFLSRKNDGGLAKGFMEVAFPFIVAVLPIIITLTPMNFRDIWPFLIQFIDNSLSNRNVLGVNLKALLFHSWESAFFLFIATITCGGVINLTGLLTLRKAFTIMSEARVLVRRGIFSLVRHPLYTGQAVTFFGYLMFHLYWYTFVFYILFILGQYYRARIEENKLMNAFPEYASYMQSTGMFFPKITRSKSHSTI